MALNDPMRLSDGLSSILGGMDGGKTPDLIKPNQCALLENLVVRGGRAETRPGLKQLAINTAPDALDTSLSGWVVQNLCRYPIQGIGFYEDHGSRGYLMVAAGGMTFRLDVTSSVVGVEDITVPTDPNSDVMPKVYMQQADGYMIFQDGVSLPQIFDGSISRRSGTDEVPLGTGPMAFGMGRLWVAQGEEYVAGDIIGGPTGVLKFTENDYLNEGGTFRVPLNGGWITAMQFTASLTTATGQGELMVATASNVFSTVVPTDRTTWKNTADPIQRVVQIENGCVSQESAVLVNGDVFMRSRDGIRSVIQAFRDFSQYGNVPISRELQDVLGSDDESLLQYSSAVLFDNRLLTTCGSHPRRSRAGGAYFDNLAALDFDLITTMAEKAAPAWDGIWTGYRFLKLTKGRFQKKERAFTVVEDPNRGFIRSVIIRSNTHVTPKAADGWATTAVPAFNVPTGGGTNTNKGYVFAVFKTISATIITGGTGYVVGDTLALADTPFIIQGVYAVTSVGGGGAVTGISLINPGLYVQSMSLNPDPLYGRVLVTSGIGTGCRLLPTFELSAGVTAFYSIHEILPHAGSEGTGYVIGDFIAVTDPATFVSVVAVVQDVTATGAVKSMLMGGDYGGQFIYPPSGKRNGYDTQTLGVGTGLTVDFSYHLDTSSCGSGYSSQPTITVALGSGTGTPEVIPVMEYEWSLYEITKSDAFDKTADGTEVPITSAIETGSYSFANQNKFVAARDQKRLSGAELWIDQIIGDVNFNLKFRPDQYPCWQDWYSWSHSTLYKDCGPSATCAPKTYLTQNRPRVGVPEPPITCDPATGRSLNFGREFQARLEWTGHAQLRLLELVAQKTPEENTVPPAPLTESATGLECPCIS
jgi:hypothetical protein